MDANFKKVDLHIHTPSSNCYTGKRNDDEYLNILMTAKKNDLDVIAITDHNTIAGYKKILQIKDDLIEEKINCEKARKTKQNKLRLKSITQKLSYYEGIMILPGIEYEAKPGVHILIIFNNSVKVCEIEEFLKKGGYSGENCGIESPVISDKWEIMELYSEASKYDCLVIDAHTDSDKGMFNVLRSGNYRAECFSSVYLDGVCYNSEKQKENLSDIIKSSNDYKRTKPLAFIKSSDAHCTKEIGSKYFWINFQKLTYDAFKNAFGNPNENISIEYPDIRKIIDNLLKNETSFGVLDFSDESKVIATKIIAGLNNTNGGYILFGISEKKHKIGLVWDKSALEIKKYIDSIHSLLPLLDTVVKPRINYYPLDEQKIIISMFIPHTNNLIGCNSEKIVYIIKNQKVLSISPKEIQQIVEERKSKIIQRKVNKSFEIIENEKAKINSYFKAIEILRYYEEQTTPITAVIEYEHIKPFKLDKTSIGTLVDAGLYGKNRGDIICIEEKTDPRYEYAYLRYSAPLYSINNNGKNKLYLKKKNECIYVVYGGGTFYSAFEYPHYSPNSYGTLHIKSKDKEKYSNKYICAFIKSSINLWYCINQFENLNIYKKDIITNLRLPNFSNKPAYKNLSNEIEDNFNKILILEKEILNKIPKAKNVNDRTDMIDQHNKKVDLLALKIDKSFFTILGFGSSQVADIENDLIANKIYYPIKLDESIKK
jgi:hypothetical protein